MDYRATLLVTHRFVWIEKVDKNDASVSLHLKTTFPHSPVLPGETARAG